jgi:cell division septation protein DedD
MAGKGTRHRFELSRLEIVGVLASAVAGLFVVFLLGVYAGRGLADRRPDGEQIVRVPIAPAAEQTPAAEEGLTFYDTLGRDPDERRAGDAVAPARRDAAPAGRPPVAAASPVAAPPVERAAGEPADGEAAPRERVAKAEPPVEPAPRETSARAAMAAPARPAPAASPAGRRAERAPAPPSTARVAVALAPAASATPGGRKGDWSVQVSATRDPRTADAILRRLKGKGYDAFVLKVRRRGETFYRVRVGHFASLGEAQKVVTRLRREPGVPEAFVASD